MRPLYYTVFSPRESPQTVFTIFGDTHRISWDPAEEIRITIGSDHREVFSGYVSFGMTNCRVFAVYPEGPDKEILPEISGELKK